MNIFLGLHMENTAEILNYCHQRDPRAEHCAERIKPRGSKNRFYVASAELERAGEHFPEAPSAVLCPVLGSPLQER